MSVIDDFKLLELVQQNNHLYNKQNPDYRDTLKKTITWNAIGAVLGASGDLCHKRFRGLRDRFTKEKKIRQEEMLTDPALPAVYKKMLFLWDHLTHRRLVPVATRLRLAPPEELAREIERQVLLLKEERAETKETQSTPNDEGDERDSQNVEASTSKEVTVENIAEENSLPLASNQIDSTPGPSCRILFVKKALKDGSVETSENDKQMLENINESGIGAFSKNEVSFEKSKALHNKKGILTKMRLKRKFSQNDLQSILYNSKRKFRANIEECNGQQGKSTAHNIVQSSRPSSNEAFCIVVKNYLDQITNPERLSAARLQILTTLHNELYSTYS